MNPGTKTVSLYIAISQSVFKPRLGPSKTQQWLENCREALQLNRKAEHSAELMSHYRNRVSEIFDDLPEARERLLRFADG